MAKKKAKKKTKQKTKQKTKKKKTKTRKPARKSKRPRAMNKRKARAERELEEGLLETFPGSDPLAQTDPTRSIKE
jgi:hypothetical protein